MDEMGFFVSENLHHDSIRNIFYAPMSFFDTTVCSFYFCTNSADSKSSRWAVSSVYSARTWKVRRWNTGIVASCLLTLTCTDIDNQLPGKIVFARSIHSSGLLTGYTRTDSVHASL